jgi:cytochrome c oxidase cbb3-type subunit 2
VNSGPLIFLGTFFALSTSWLGFVLAPQLQFGRDNQVIVETTGEAYPAMRPGLARQGEQVYRANGCFYCHSQQVRPKGMGADVERGWGARSGLVQSVDRDYLYGAPVMLGNQRVGPDLANLGLRSTNEAQLLQHLYNPSYSMPKSVMPPYHFLFVKHDLKFGEKPSPNALPEALTGPTPDYEIVPSDDARALVAYLVSLRSDATIFETPPGKSAAKPKAAAATNAPAAAPASAAPTPAPAK